MACYAAGWDADIPCQSTDSSSGYSLQSVLVCPGAASGATTGVPATHRVTKMEFLVPNFGLSYPLLLWPFGDESVNGSFLLFPVFDSTSSINKSFKI